MTLQNTCSYLLLNSYLKNMKTFTIAIDHRKLDLYAKDEKQSYNHRQRAHANNRSTQLLMTTDAAAYHFNYKKKKIASCHYHLGE